MESNKQTIQPILRNSSKITHESCAIVRTIEPSANEIRANLVASKLATNATKKLIQAF